MKKFLFGEAYSAIDNYKQACPVGYNKKADDAALRLAKFAKKENPTDAEIEQAKKDNDILKEAIESEKKDAKNREKGAKVDKIVDGVVLGGTALFNLYYNLYGCDKLSEKHNKKYQELIDRLDNGEYIPDSEIEKVRNNMVKINILSNTLSSVGSLSRKILTIYGSKLTYNKIKQKTGSDIASATGALAVAGAGLIANGEQQKAILDLDAFDNGIAQHKKIEVIDIDESAFDDLNNQINAI